MSSQEEESKKSEYYSQGNSELATETPLTISRQGPRWKLTQDSVRLVIVLVGLPARGKSFVARKLHHFMQWYGVHCKIFNVGRYRREAHALATASSGQCAADFFDSKNTEAAALREKVAELALRDMLRWLDDEGQASKHTASGSDSDSEDSDSKQPGGSSVGSMSAQRRRSPNQDVFSDRIAIFDATNSTDKRRQWLLEECTSPLKRAGKPTGMIFVESICDDAELLLENFRFKVSSSPDYAGMSQDDAIADLRQRVAKYEEQYETITDDSLSYIKIYNLSTKLLVNHIYGRMAKVIVPALMAWNIGTRPIYLCRPGQTMNDIMTDGEDYVSKVDITDPKLLTLSARSKKQVMRGDSLGPAGTKFTEELYTFIYEECSAFMRRRASTMDMAPTGTSVTGLAPGPWYSKRRQSTMDSDDTSIASSRVNMDKGLPLKIYTSTMPRAIQTSDWKAYGEFQTEEKSHLNPLDKGDFAGKELEEIKTLDVDWYNRLERDPFYTRFPGGESYRDLIQRLESMIVEIEQQVTPTLIVSHVSVLQMLIAYFRNSPIDKAMSIEVPLHTVLKFTPARGGGWSETQHILSPVGTATMTQVESVSEMSSIGHYGEETPVLTTPIWGDHVRRVSSLSLNGKILTELPDLGDMTKQ